MRKAEAIQAMTDTMMLQRKSRWTIKAYLEWVGKFADYCAQHPAGTHEEKIGGFLSYLVNRLNIDIKTTMIYLHLVKRKSDVVSPLDTRATN